MNFKLFMTSENKSQNSKYTLIFGAIRNSNGNVRFIDHAKGKTNTIRFTINDQEFGYRVQQNCSTLIADLIDLAVAIYASDRLTSQNPRQKQRCLDIFLPVRHPELLNAESFQLKLAHLLGWVTGSQWHFNFQKRTAAERFVEHQSLPIGPQGCEVALWSGGLDALAGLYTRLQVSSEKSFVLFGTGSNNIVYAHQGKVAKEIRSIFPGRSTLYRVRICFDGSNTHPKNKVARARGVVFTLLGATCAYLMGQKELFVYENGVGAINLPYRKSSVGLDHTRSVHPLTLLMVSELVSELLQERFRVHNPFLFWTKAKMCQALAKDGRFDLPPLTKSCDSPHRKRPSQCGYCSSCILRKQALAASKIEDQTRYVVPHGSKPKGDVSSYLQHMLTQVSTLRSLLNATNMSSSQWESLTKRFPELDDIVDRGATAENMRSCEMQESLIRLYKTYVAEWDIVESQISASLSNHIRDQQISDECLTAVRTG